MTNQEAIMLLSDIKVMIERELRIDLAAYKKKQHRDFWVASYAESLEIAIRALESLSEHSDQTEMM